MTGHTQHTPPVATTERAETSHARDYLFWWARPYPAPPSGIKCAIAGCFALASGFTPAEILQKGWTWSTGIGPVCPSHAAPPDAALLARAEQAEAERNKFHQRAALVDPLVGRAQKAEADAIAQRERAERAEAESDDLHALADITRAEHGHQYGLANNALTQALTETAALRARIEAACDSEDATLGGGPHDNFALGLLSATFAVRKALADPNPGLRVAVLNEPPNPLLGAAFGTDPPTVGIFMRTPEGNLARDTLREVEGKP